MNTTVITVNANSTSITINNVTTVVSSASPMQTLVLPSMSVVGQKGDTGPQGPKGDPGERGADGYVGADGKSAYQVAVANGFVGTEAEWLASLVGPAGDPASNIITSVNSKVGTVVLTYADVGAEASGTAASAVTSHVAAVDPHGDRSYAQNLVSSQSTLDRQYTDNAIAAVVASAPATLDTLNELAAALGNDANFATTTSTALGYRLRFDVNTQGLSPTQQQNAYTNLGLGSVVTYNYSDFATPADVAALQATDASLQTQINGKMTTAIYDSDADGIVDTAETIVFVGRNSTGSTITKGQIVYISGALGGRPTISLAKADAEATSAGTIGAAAADIPNNTDGNIVVIGTIHTLNTTAFNEGDRLWLSATTAGGLTTTQPVAPNHSVFIGYVARSHATQGRIVYRIMNGHELDELHDVLITSPAVNHFLVYDSDGLWKNKATSAVVTLLGIDTLSSQVSANTSAIAGKQNALTTGTTAQYLKGDLSLGTFASDAAAAITTTTEGALIHGATSKATPVDADELGLVDSTASNVLAKLTWANLKAALKTYFDTKYAVLAGSYTFAGKPAANSLPANTEIWISDVGPNGSKWFTTTSDWYPVNGVAVTHRLAVAAGIAPSGTINTGSSGTLTLGTALPNVYSGGIWLYLPAIATTPAITAGLYYCVMSSTTVGTIYSNGAGSAAITFTGGASYTGLITEQTLANLSFPAGMMGSNGQLEILTHWIYPNNANNKTTRIKFTDGSAAANYLASVNGSGSNNLQTEQIIRNRGTANSQEGFVAVTNSFGVWNGSEVTSTVNTAIGTNLLLTGQLATATDYLIIEGYSVKLVR